MRSSIILLVALFCFNALGVTLIPKMDGLDKGNRFPRYLELSGRVEQIVNSEEFKSRVLSKKFTTTKLYPEQIFDKIMKGSELLKPEPDQIWDWKVGFYFKRATRVIGWTNPKIMTVWVNMAKFDSFDDESIMANIAHEYMHKIGFDHASAKDHSSVPYAIGYLVEEIARNKSKPSETQEPPKIRTRKSFWGRVKSWIGL